MIKAEGYVIEHSPPKTLEINGLVERSGGIIIQILDKISPRVEIGFLRYITAKKLELEDTIPSSIARIALHNNVQHTQQGQDPHIDIDL
ncbi:hypothetical protein N7519_008627 [Penicillium mononematosum]|uniref:uncharacterized protein n=1 Tax=Penicillium mononematosum TaxID=268346 RepID=UPI002546FA27|nr:uncharacterized protein N7519_008627 [Penicillium mononematosum]KAJ6178166.1 hypothetical protein N7519_008627 [Penicillium mononematosum]